MNVKNPGNFPVASVSYFDGDKAPTVSPIAGFRFSRLGFKLTKGMKAKGESKRENFLAIVPQWNPETDFGSVSGAKLLTEIVNEFEDTLAKDIAEGDAPHSILDSVESAAKYYFDTTRDSSGRKVTKVTIGEWFMENCAEFVIKTAKAKNELMKDETLERIAAGYCEMFQKLAGYGVNHNENQYILMTRVIKESGVEGEMAEWLASKIEKCAKTFRTTDEELENAI